MKFRNQALLASICFFIIFSFSGCSLSGNQAEQDTSSPADRSNKNSAVKTYTLAEMGDHAQEGDCWLAISSKVYDVTSFISSHPGGKAILEGCGKDASELFETRPMGSGTAHSVRAHSLLSDYYIGELQ